MQKNALRHYKGSQSLLAFDDVGMTRSGLVRGGLWHFVILPSSSPGTVPFACKDDFSSITSWLCALKKLAPSHRLI